MTNPTEPRDLLPGVTEYYDRIRNAPPRPDDEIDYEEKARRLEREARWDRSIPARFRGARFADLDDEVREMLAEWVTGLELDRSRNLVIVGPVGTGKTHAAVAVARAAFDDTWNVMFAPMVELLEALRPGTIDGSSMLRSARSVGLLIIDDLGSEKSSEWTGEQLYSIVNRRWLEERPTIVTSNLTPELLGGALDERVYSRLVDNALAVRLSGDDRRRS